MRIAPPHRRTLVSVALALCVVVLTPRARAATAPAVAPANDGSARPTMPFHLADQFVVGGEGGWGRLGFDPQTRRLFASRSTTLQVIDADARKALHEITCAEGPHGLVLAPDLRRGFLTSGSDTSLAAFDLDKMAMLKRVSIAGTGAGPVVYDPATKRVLVLETGGLVSAFDAITLEQVASHQLDARPQAAVSDGAGAIYVALPEQDAIAVLDAHTLIERTRWLLESGASPAALAYDTKNHRLFAAGRGLYLDVLETERGRVVTRLPLGGGVDDMLFDPDRRLVATIGTGGASSTVWQQSPDAYMVVATVGTNAGARMLALDPKKHVLYSAAAQMLRSGRSTAPGAHPQSSIVPGSFTVFILEP
jgi:DNA-binding beta-propeller fold protein YncE